jgi:uncharacterized ferredoxin-like protein
MTPEFEAVRTVATLMALAARTAPKGKGVDTIEVEVLTGTGLTDLADAMRAYGEEHNVGFFLRDAKNIDKADACVLIGCRGQQTAEINCGGCGYPTCAEMAAAAEEAKKDDVPFRGPNCVIRATDLGIAVGSAVKTASMHNVDNRVMYSGGVGARTLGLLPDCTVVYAIPLKASGKNIFFDRS